MLEKFRIIFAIPELRKKIFFTLGFLVLYRVGWYVPLPIVNQTAMAAWASGAADGTFGDLFEQVAMFSASNLNNATIFGLGIMPYISASIIFQLLGSVYPPLEKLQKEGETGRKKINQYTRIATVVLCLFQSIVYIRFLATNGLLREEVIGSTGSLMLPWWLLAVTTMVAGTVFLMWIGEQIDEYGVGNGISLLIMAGIVTRMPAAGVELLRNSTRELGASGGMLGPDRLLFLVALFLGVVAGVVFITQAQRRIPMQSGKHVRGRRVVGGGRQYLPLRVNQSGVMPIVFASSLLMLPGMLFSLLQQLFEADSPMGAAMAGGQDMFQRGDGFLYNALYVVLIYFFCYFWTAITFNPKDMAENMKDFGSFIPGYRPGKQTANYLEKVMLRITYVGAGFLALVAIIPTMVAAWMGIDYSIASFYGGTGLLIAVSVAFDLVQKIDSHLVMRNYRGLLERT